VAAGGAAAAQDRGDFHLEGALGLWVLGQQGAGPDQGRGHCRVPGDPQGHRFIARLDCRHALARPVIPRRAEPHQHIVRGGSGATMLDDAAVYVSLEYASCPKGLAVVARGQPQRRGQHRPDTAVELPQRSPEGQPRGQGLWPGRRAEQDPAHDLLREVT
jgi:hypothetical protein